MSHHPTNPAASTVLTPTITKSGLQWWQWIPLMLLADAVLLGLVGAGYLPVEVVGLLFALEVLLIKWMIVVWLIRRVVRFLRSK